MERLCINFKVEKGKLVFKGKGIKPVPRMPIEMKDVVMDPDGLEIWERKKKPLYLMYRGVERLADKEIRNVFKENSVRYDLTLISPGFIGQEYVKTHGHFHPSSGKGRYYSEVYEVLSGHGMILLQHRKMRDFIVYYVEKGDSVFIPGEYGHVTVNSGKRHLLLANIVIDGFKSEYGPVKRKRGFAYYALDGDIFIPNPRYKEYPTIAMTYGERTRIDKAFLEMPKIYKDLLLGK